MEENTPAPTLLNHTLRWGMITAAVSIIITLLMYAIDYTLMIQLKILFISLAVYLGITIYGGIDYRKTAGGFLPYGKAWQHGFLVLAISGLVATLFSLLLYNVVDPELPEKLVDASIENTRELMEKFGAPADSIDDALDKAREQTANRFTVGGILLGYVQIAIFSAIMALISALFVRKNRPEMV
jgi:hypothetical protein